MAPHGVGERIDLAEVGGALDRSAEEPERGGRVVVMDAGAAVHRLLRQQLDRAAERPVDGEWRLECSHGFLRESRVADAVDVVAEMEGRDDLAPVTRR